MSVTPIIAAIVHPGKHLPHCPIPALVNRLRKQGWRVRGLINDTADGPFDCSALFLRDVHSKARYPISQPRGKQALACGLDAGALMDTASVLHQAHQARPDLALVNRFGKLEAMGQGFVQEMLDFMVDDIPLLTVVSSDHLDSWRVFTDCLAQELPPQLDALLAWAQGLPAAQWHPLGKPLYAST